MPALLTDKFEAVDTNLSKIWGVLASFSYSQTTEPKFIEFWLKLVSKCINLLKGEVHGHVVESLIGASVTMLRICLWRPDMEEQVKLAMSGQYTGGSSEILPYLRVHLPLDCREVDYFEAFRHVHGQKWPSVQTIIRRTLLFGILTCKIQPKWVVEMNQDYFNGEIDGDFLICRWIYEAIFRTPVIEFKGEAKTIFQELLTRRGNVFDGPLTGDAVFYRLISGWTEHRMEKELDIAEPILEMVCQFKYDSYSYWEPRPKPRAWRPYLEYCPVQNVVAVLNDMSDREKCFELLDRFYPGDISRDKEKVEQFWIVKVAKFIRKFWNGYEFDVSLLVQIFRLCWTVVSSESTESFEPFLRTLLSDEPLPEEPEITEYPLGIFFVDCPLSYALDTEKFWKEYRPFECPSPQKVVARGLLFASYELQVDLHPLIIAANEKYEHQLCGDVVIIPERTLSTVTEFCTLRYVVEVLQHWYCPRPLGADEPPEDASFGRQLSSFIYYDMPAQIPLNGQDDVIIRYLTEISRNHIVNISQLLGLSKASFFAEMPNSDLLLYHSALGCEEASLELLQKPECVPLLSDKYMHHRLLKIFHSPHTDLVWDKLDFEITREAAAEFLWRYRLPDDCEFCLSLFEIVYEKFREELYRLYETEFIMCSFEDWYVSCFLPSGPLETSPCICPSEPSEFFDNDMRDLSWYQVFLVAILKQLAKLNAEDRIDKVIASDLGLCSIAPALSEMVEVRIRDRVVFWKIFENLSDSSPREIAENPELWRGFLIDAALMDMGIDMDSEASLALTPSVCNEFILWDISHDKSQLRVMSPHLSESGWASCFWDMFALSRYDAAFEIFHMKRWTRESIVRLIQVMPRRLLEGDLSSELVSFCEYACRYLPSFRTSRIGEKRSESGNQMEWPEDYEKSSKEAPKEDTEGCVNLWEEQQLNPVCDRTGSKEKRIGFVCNDCYPSTKHLICAACAVHCHHDHNVVFGRFCEYTCDCESICGCQMKSSTPESLTTDVLVPLFIALANFRGALPARNPWAELPFVENLTTMSLNLPVKEDLRLVFGEAEKRLLKLEKLDNIYSGTEEIKKQHQKRFSAATVRLTATTDSTLFVAAGRKIKIFRLHDLTKLATFQIGLVPVYLSCQETSHGDVMLAVSGVSHVEVYSFTRENQSLLICSTVPETDMILSVDWVERDFISVLYRESLKVYKVTNSPAPVSAFQTFTGNGQDNACTSVIYVEHDGVLHAVIALRSGVILAQPLSLSAPKSGQLMDSRLLWGSRYVSISITCNPAANLMFMTAPGVSLQVYRLNEIWDSNPAPKVQVSIGHSECRFLCSFPGCDSQMIFVHPASNALYALSIGEAALGVTNLTSPVPGLRFLGGTLLTYACFPRDGTLCVITGDGSARRLTRAEVDYHWEYRVPPTFWSQATRATSKTTNITGTDPSQNYNTLYSASVAFFRKEVLRRRLSFHVHNPNECIVGVMLAFGSSSRSYRPEWVSLNGRKYNTSRDQNYMFPLMPHEVRPGQSLDLEFPNDTREVTMQEAAVFTMPFEKIQGIVNQAVLEGTWGASSSLLDFSDRDILENPTAKGCCLGRLSKALLVKDTDVIPDQYYKELVRIVYTVPDASLAARNVLVRLCRVHGDGIRHWESGLKEVIAEGCIAESRWAHAWRDMIVIGEQSGISDDIWASSPPIGCGGSVLAAFMTSDSI